MLNLTCRICGADKMKDSVVVNKYFERIENSFYVNTSFYNKTVHPQKMCRRCYTILRNIEKVSSTCVKTMNWPLPCADKSFCFPKVSGRKVKKLISNLLSFPIMIWPWSISFDLVPLYHGTKSKEMDQADHKYTVHKYRF